MMSALDRRIFLLCLLAVFHTARSVELCERDTEEHLINSSTPLDLTYSGSDVCQCTVTSARPARVDWDVSLEQSGAGGCGGALLVTRGHVGYTVCSGRSALRDVITEMQFTVVNPGGAAIRSLAIHIAALSEVRVACHSVNQSSHCPCEWGAPADPPPVSLPTVTDTSTKNRLIAGVVASIVFHICVAVAIVLYHVYFKRQSYCQRDTTDKSEMSASTADMDNLGYHSNRTSQSFLYDEIDPVTGRTRIRIEPDTSLNLAPQYSVEQRPKDSTDSGLYSLARDYNGVESVSPYASSGSVLPSEHDVGMTGCGLMGPASISMHDLHYTEAATLPADFRRHPDHDAGATSADAPSTRAQLTEAELDAMYAKPWRTPREPRPASVNLDVDIPMNISDMLNASVSSETVV